MVSGNREVRSRPPTETCCMKKSTDTPHMPSVTSKEVSESVDSSKVIFLRVSPQDHKAVKAAASTLRLTVTEYLLRCHALVAAKLEERSK